MLDWLLRKTKNFERHTENTNISYSFQGEAVYKLDDGDYVNGKTYPFLFICIEENQQVAEKILESELLNFGWFEITTNSYKEIITSEKENTFVVYAEKCI